MRPWLAYDALILVAILLVVALVTLKYWYPPLARFVRGTRRDIETATEGKSEKLSNEQMRYLRRLTPRERNVLREAGWKMPDEREFE